MLLQAKVASGLSGALESLLGAHILLVRSGVFCDGAQLHVGPGLIIVPCIAGGWIGSGRRDFVLLNR
jgi:hypothetical protein